MMDDMRRICCIFYTYYEKYNLWKVIRKKTFKEEQAMLHNILDKRDLL